LLAVASDQATFSIDQRLLKLNTINQLRQVLLLQHKIFC